MNVRLSAGLLAMAAAALTLSHDTPEVHATPAFTMYCRGGNVHKVIARAARKTPTGKPRLAIFSEYWLTKSKQRYSPQTLNKGECAWADRPISSREPTRLFSKGHWAAPGAEMQATFGPRGNGNFDLRAGTMSQMGLNDARYFQALNDDSKIVELAVRTEGKEFRVAQVRAIHSAPGNHVKRRGSK